MDPWLNTPMIVIAILAVPALACRFGYWVSRVNKERSSIAEALDSLRKYGREEPRGIREELAEVRNDIKKIFL